MHIFGIKIHLDSVIEGVLSMIGVIALLFVVYILTGHNFLGYQKEQR